MKRLKPKHLQFLEAYLNNGNNGTRAYLTAYPGRALVTAQQSSSKLLKNSLIQEELQRRIERRLSRGAAKNLASREYLIERAAKIDDAAYEAQQFQTSLNSVDLRAKLNKLYDKAEPELQGYTNLIQTLIINNNAPVEGKPMIDVTPVSGDTTPDVGMTGSVNRSKET